MLIVGELINTSRKEIDRAVKEQDAAFIKDLAVKQTEAGCHYIDVNCGTMVHNEPETMQWLVRTVQEAVDTPLCLDSPSPEALEAGLALVKNGQPLINSISAEAERFHNIMPLVVRYRAKIVALCLGDGGMPNDAGDRIAIFRRLIADLTAGGVGTDDIYVDPLVTPVSTADHCGLDVLEAVRCLKQEFPTCHAICGLSNISYGLPNRKTLNQVFMIQLMTAGMDAYILDPLDRTLMGFLYASQATLGQDPYCMQYLAEHRKGLYEKRL